MPTYSGVFFRPSSDPGLYDAVLRLRKRVFVDQCGWDLQIVDEREFDQFDRDDTVHAALLRKGGLVGSFRIRTTSEPYLADSVFPGLATDRPYPRDADCAEISRFGIDRDVATHEDAVRLYALMFWYARRRRIRALVALCDPTYERFLRGLGVRTLRYGPPQTVDLDAFGRPIEVMAGEIPMAAQAGPRFQTLLATCDDMEIRDETSVFGRRRLSA